MTKLGNRPIIIGVGFVFAILISISIGIPLYYRHSSQKADEQQKKEINTKINLFNSSFSGIEKNPNLQVKDLEELANIYEEISTCCLKISNFESCTKFITPNGLVDKLAPLKPKFRRLLEDLYKRSLVDPSLMPEFNKLLAFGLIDDKAIFDLNSKAQELEQERADSLDKSSQKAQEDLATKSNDILLKEQQINELENELNVLKTKIQETEIKNEPLLNDQKVEDLEKALKEKNDEFILKTQQISNLEEQNANQKKQLELQKQNIILNDVEEVTSLKSKLKEKEEELSNYKDKYLKLADENTLAKPAQKLSSDGLNQKNSSLEKKHGDLKKLPQSTVKESEKFIEGEIVDLKKQLDNEILKNQKLFEEYLKAKAGKSEPCKIIIPENFLGPNGNLKLAISKFAKEQSVESLLEAFNICKQVHNNNIDTCEELFKLSPSLRDSVVNPTKILILHDEYASSKVAQMLPNYLKILANIIKGETFGSLSWIDEHLRRFIYAKIHKELIQQLSNYIDGWFKIQHRKADLRNDISSNFILTGSADLREFWADFRKQNEYFVFTFEHTPSFNDYKKIITDLIEKDFQQLTEMIKKLIVLVSSNPFSSITLDDPCNIMYQVILDDLENSYYSDLDEYKSLIPRPFLGQLRGHIIPNSELLFQEILNKEGNVEKVGEKVFRKSIRVVSELVSRPYRKLVEIKLLEAAKSISVFRLSLKKREILSSEVLRKIKPVFVGYTSFVLQILEHNSTNQILKGVNGELFSIFNHPNRTISENGKTVYAFVNDLIYNESERFALSVLFRKNSRFIQYYNSLLKRLILDKWISSDLLLGFYNDNKMIQSKLHNMAPF
jgi:hypothetical protein